MASGVVITAPEAILCGYGKTAVLTTQIVTNAVDYSVTFVSDDPKIASVDENGVVTGVRFGKTAVRCVVTDAGGYEHVSEPCAVRVRGNLALWFLRIITFLKNLF